MPCCSRRSPRRLSSISGFYQQWRRFSHSKKIWVSPSQTSPIAPRRAFHTGKGPPCLGQWWCWKPPFRTPIQKAWWRIWFWSCLLTKGLMRKLDDKLKEYGKNSSVRILAFEKQFYWVKIAVDELVSRIRTYTSLDVPDSRVLRNVQSFGNWIHNHQPLASSESWLVHHKHDLVCLSNGREYGWLDGAIENSLFVALPRRLIKVRVAWLSRTTICRSSNER